MSLKFLIAGDKKITTHIEVKNYYTSCEPIKVEYLPTKKKYNVNVGSNLSELNSEKIVSVEIEVDGLKNYDLSNNIELGALNLKNLRHLIIKETNNVNLKISFQNWPNRTSINNDSLKTFILDGYSICDTALSYELSHFSNLKQLQLPFYTNSELSNLKNLQSAIITNSLYFFTNNLVCINSLKKYYETTTLGFNFFRPDLMYAQKHFFFNNLNVKNIEHPIYTIDSLLNIKYSGKLTGTKKIYLLYKEAYYDWSENDTLASGEIIDGKKSGIWKYNLDPYNPPYFYNYENNHDCSSVSFPLNGEWVYKYSTGAIAIRGFFKDGQKDSLWIFYKPDGKIESYKTYKNDNPYGLFIDYEKDKQIRKYYFNQFHYIMEISEKGEKNYYTIPTGNEGFREGYNTGPNGDLYLITNEKALKKIKKKSPEYKKILQQHFLKYLYAK